MRYFVLTPNGGSYGPADIDLLKTWVAEGRIAPSTILREDGTGVTLPAQQVPELAAAFALAAPPPPVTPRGVPCPNCGRALAAGPVRCPGCGFDFRPKQARNFTPYASLDWLLGLLLFGGIFLAAWFGPGVIGGFGQISPLMVVVAPLVLFFTLRETRPAFARGVASGCLLLPLLLLGFVLFALYAMTHPVQYPNWQIKCFG